MDMNKNSIEEMKEREEMIKTIVNMGVFVKAASQIGLSMDEIKDMIQYIAKKREEKRNGKKL